MRGEFDSYDYLSAEEIIGACDGDLEALGSVVMRYENYARKCLRGIASKKYGLEMKSLPKEDLMQEVWLELIRVLRKRFKP